MVRNRSSILKEVAKRLKAQEPWRLIAYCRDYQPYHALVLTSDPGGPIGNNVAGYWASQEYLSTGKCVRTPLFYLDKSELSSLLSLSVFNKFRMTREVTTTEHLV